MDSLDPDVAGASARVAQDDSRYHDSGGESVERKNEVATAFVVRVEEAGDGDHGHAAKLGLDVVPQVIVSRSAILDLESVTCRYCRIVLESNEAVIKHCRDAHSVATEKFQCRMCDALFLTKYDQMIHMGNCHPVVLPPTPPRDPDTTAESSSSAYPCTRCKRRFPDLKAVIDHVRNAHNVQCQVCNYHFGNKSSLMAHVSKAHPDVTYQSPRDDRTCVFCKKILCSTENMRKHIVSVHENRSSHQCDTCGKRLSTACALRTHKKTVHFGIKDVACSDCGRTFTSHSSLKAHVMSAHKGSKFPCHVCGKKLSSQSGLKLHVATVHEKSKVHECDLCGRGFLNPRCLTWHKQSLMHAEAKYKCRFCDRMFSAPLFRKVHENRVHAKLYKSLCELCAQEFSSRQCLRRHMDEVHRRSDLLACDVCQKKFKRKTDLRVHKTKVHEDNNGGKSQDFMCDVCGKSLRNRTSLIIHTRVVHHQEVNHSRIALYPNVSRGGPVRPDDDNKALAILNNHSADADPSHEEPGDVAGPDGSDRTEMPPRKPDLQNCNSCFQIFGTLRQAAGQKQLYGGFNVDIAHLMGPVRDKSELPDVCGQQDRPESKNCRFQMGGYCHKKAQTSSTSQISPKTTALRTFTHK